MSSASLSLALPLGAAFADGPAEEDSPAVDFERAADDRLIDRTLAGQTAAFGDLVRRHQDRLRASLARLTGSVEEAEDVAQEAFVQAYLKLPSFQRSSRFYTWVYRIAFNLAVSKSRKRRPRVSLTAVQEAGGADPTTDAPGPTEPLLRNERASLLHAAIAELEEEHRQVIVLREFDDMDYQQIADVIGAPIGTVRSRLFRARAQLRQRLAGVLGEGDASSDGPSSGGADPRN